jgi:polar amino acid transport system substrate-binding protein
MRHAVLAAITATAIGFAANAEARPLQVVQGSGTLGLCAHPNALPYANKHGNPPGFELELGQAIARQLGVTLVADWVISSAQIRRAECDIVLDVISDAEAQSESGLRLSHPYYRSGVGLAVRPDSTITSFAALNKQTKVGVQVGSMAAMVLGKRGVGLSMFGFEDDMVAAVASGEVAAAAVSPFVIGYYNHQHPDQALRYVPPDPAEPRLIWNVGAGLVKPDPAMQAAIDAAIGKLAADGTIASIYARYGVTLQPPL